MKIFIYLILEQGIQDEGVERVVKSILSDGDSLDRWSQILDDWLKHEGVKHDLGNDRQVQIGLNFIVTAGGGLYVKRTEFDLDADQISDIMVKTFMSTFLSIDESKISQTLAEAKSALQKYELTTLTPVSYTHLDVPKVTTGVSFSFALTVLVLLIAVNPKIPLVKIATSAVSIFFIIKFSPYE